jgi:hypothetical protein
VALRQKLHQCRHSLARLLGKDRGQPPAAGEEGRGA